VRATCRCQARRVQHHGSGSAPAHPSPVNGAQSPPRSMHRATSVRQKTQLAKYAESFASWGLVKPNLAAFIDPFTEEDVGA
jgi:hypothetical protein